MKWLQSTRFKSRRKLNNWIDGWLNRGLADGARLGLTLRWPLLLVPLFALSQLLTPHRVWTALLITIGCLYGFAYLWVRSQAGEIRMSRRREGEVMIAGDPLVEQFEIENESLFPLLWAEFADESEMPGYSANRVVACAGASRYRWQNKSVCPRRGSYQLGPATLTWGDPFGLFHVTQFVDESETVLIYPRVPHLPDLVLPFGSTSGARRRRRPLAATLKSASIRAYQSGDSLRYIHWPATARHAEMMVTEREMEPGGDVWIVVDTQAGVHSGLEQVDLAEEESTFEYCMMVAAGLASQLLGSNERQSVGLLTATGSADGSLDPITILPQSGMAQFWRIMAKLAAIAPADLPLDALLQSNRELLSRGQTILLITPACDDAPQWIAELAHAQSQVAGTVYLIEAADALPDSVPNSVPNSVAGAKSVLTSYDISVQTLKAGSPLESALTYRRTRRIIRSTPAGGAITLEVEEEVG